MKNLDYRLYELLGDQSLSFGCVVILNNEREARLISEEYDEDSRFRFIDDKEYIFKSLLDEMDVIGHEPTIADLHTWLHQKYPFWWQARDYIFLDMPSKGDDGIWYDSRKSLLEQSDETKQAIIDLITSHS